MQRAALEIILLAPMAGYLGAQIVLRRLAFYTHGVGASTFPGLVLAGPLGLPPAAAGLGVGLLFAAGLERLGRWTRLGIDVLTALLLVTALAIGIVLASDVYQSGAEVDQLLFGSLLAIGDEELRTTALALALALPTVALFRRSWIASGFEHASSRSLGLPVARADWALVAMIAIAVVTSLDAIGALLVSSLLVIPAATVRLFARSMGSLELAAAALALTEGIAGLWIAYQLDVPPGPAIGALGGLVFAACVVARLVSAGRLVASAT